MTSDTPIADLIEHSILHPVQAVESWFEPRHTASQAPAQQPVNLAAAPAAAEPPKENPVSLATIAEDIKTAIGNADDWARQAIETHLPALVAEAEKYGGSTIEQVAEKLAGAFIPPQLEPVLVGLVDDFVKRYGQQQAAPDGAAPAEPAQAPA